MASGVASHRITQLRELTATQQHEAACSLADSMLQSGAADRETLYLAALNRRLVRRVDDAFALLDAFERQHPGFSRIHQERGHCWLARRNVGSAIEAFERAVAVNATLTDSWRQLARLYALVSKPAEVQRALAELAHLDGLPQPLRLAASLFADGDLERAEEVLNGLGRDPGADPRRCHLLARIRQARGAWFDAQCLFEEALKSASGNRALRLDYVRLLLERQNHAAALAQLDVLDASGEHPCDPLMRASALAGLGDYPAAIALLQDLLLSRPSGGACLALGDCLRAVGRQADAILAYQRAATYGEQAASCWSLANLKTHRFSAAELANMNDLLASPVTRPEARELLHFALASALRMESDFGSSWLHMKTGSALHRCRVPYRIDRHEQLVEELVATADKAFFSARAGWGHASADALFIVGLPRSGSTLVEQMLGAHPEVDATHELGELPALVHDLEGRMQAPTHSYAGVLAGLDREQAAESGRRYLEATRVHRGAARCFTDKLPNNFLHAGLIHVMLPQARIIDVRREPRDCCMSNLLQRFASGQEFTYDPEDMARFYRMYLRLMEHWHATLPGRVLTVHYEDLVSRPEQEIRCILDHCGLEFDARCLAFHSSIRRVSTPSSEQVRRPLSRDAVGSWRDYAPWLDSLTGHLGDALHRYRAGGQLLEEREVGAPVAATTVAS